MKRFILVFLCILGFESQAQTNTQLLDHYRAYYNQMKIQGDSQGIINGLTHLIVLSPNDRQAYKDTLAMVYMSEGNHVQALNTIGIDKNTSDSNIAVEVKAVSLKALNEVDRSLAQFEELFSRTPDPSIAYELAELYLQSNKLEESNTYIEYGLTNAKENMGKVFYESQQPYKVPIKAAFLYLKALATFNENKTTNIDSAITIMDEALELAPNFNLAQISKNALISQKNKPEEKK
ncbi:tetratricopeptide repeat protein [Bizionia sp. KMM 8389]